jgi:hypothetical protein
VATESQASTAILSQGVSLFLLFLQEIISEESSFAAGILKVRIPLGRLFRNCKSAGGLTGTATVKNIAEPN